jgi:DNA polymerase-3 subunit alpha
MDTIGAEYIARSRGARAVSYEHEIMEQITEETYGLVVYQEQVMLAMTQLAGMSMTDANKVRKIIGKKKDPIEFEAFKDKWMEGARKNISKARAERLWKDFEAHAGYSFNKSHAVAYGMLTYWTAWLKHYYPLEFMHAVLLHITRSTGKDKKDKITNYLIEAKRLGIQILLPHVNGSESEWSIDKSALRFGLSSIKFLSTKLAGRVIANRPFTDYQDLHEKVTTKNSGLTVRVLSSLNAIGAAAFPDNPRHGKERDNLYEYLGVPAFEVRDLESIVKAKIRTLDEYDEDSVFCVMGMIRKIVRGEGWARVDVVDETGNAGIFASQDIPMETGNMYAMLVSNNRIMRYVTIEELVNKVKSAFVDYLYSRPGELVADGALKVIAFRTHVTKNGGKKMAYVVVLDDLDQLYQVMAFPGKYYQALAHCGEGELIDAEINETDDGSLFFKEVKPWTSKILQDSPADN